MRKLARYWLTFIGIAWAFAASGTIILFLSIGDSSSDDMLTFGFWFLPLQFLAGCTGGCGLWLWSVDHKMRLTSDLSRSRGAISDGYSDVGAMLMGLRRGWLCWILGAVILYLLNMGCFAYPCLTLGIVLAVVNHRYKS